MKPSSRRGRVVVPKAGLRIGDIEINPAEFLDEDSALSAEDQRSERDILAELAKAGVYVSALDDIVNLKAPAQAVPVLLRCLGGRHSVFTKMRITWSLQTKAIRKHWRDVVRCLVACRSRRVGEHIAVAITCGAGKEQVDDVAKLCRRNLCYGRDALLDWLKTKKYSGLTELAKELRNRGLLPVMSEN